MAITPTKLLVAGSLGLSAFAAAAQVAADAQSPAAPPPLALALPVANAPASAPPTNTPSSANSRVVSPEIAEALASVMPKYDPPAVHVVSNASSSTVTPENGIVRLPAYIVRAPKVPEFTERELYTPEGLKKLAVKRYISELDQALNHFRIPLLSGYSTAPDRGSSPEARAMQLFEQDEAKSRAAEESDLMSLSNIR